jgi:hypothetical protein
MQQNSSISEDALVPTINSNNAAMMIASPQRFTKIMNDIYGFDDEKVCVLFMCSLVYIYSRVYVYSIAYVLSCSYFALLFILQAMSLLAQHNYNVVETFSATSQARTNVIIG